MSIYLIPLCKQSFFVAISATSLRWGMLYRPIISWFTESDALRATESRHLNLLLVKILPWASPLMALCSLPDIKVR